MCFIYTVMWQELQLDGTYFQKGQRQSFGNRFQIILTVCSHVKLQEFKATGEMRLLFVRPARPHGFIYIIPLGCDVGAEVKSLVFRQNRWFSWCHPWRAQPDTLTQTVSGFYRKTSSSSPWKCLYTYMSFVCFFYRCCPGKNCQICAWYKPRADCCWGIERWKWQPQVARNSPSNKGTLT